MTERLEIEVPAELADSAASELDFGTIERALYLGEFSQKLADARLAADQRDKLFKLLTITGTVVLLA